MAKEKIEPVEAIAIWQLWCQVPSMKKAGLLTEEQKDTLKAQLNDRLHEALDIPEE